MRSLRRKRRWRLLGSSSASSKKTSASYQDCALCRTCAHPADGGGQSAAHHQHHQHYHQDDARASRRGRRSGSKTKQGKDPVRVICYCDTNAETLPLLQGNCYRSVCTAAEPPAKDNKGRSKPSRAVVRCLNVARDLNLRDNRPCPTACPTHPANATNGDHNFFFGRADLNNNEDEHVVLQDTCVSCCVISTHAPPKLYCFDKPPRPAPAPAPAAPAVVGDGLAAAFSRTCTESAAAKPAGGSLKRGENRRRSLSRRRSRFSLPQLPSFLRKPKALVLQRSPSSSASLVTTPKAIPDDAPSTPIPPVPAARSTVPNVVNNPLYQEVTRVPPTPPPRPQQPQLREDSEECSSVEGILAETPLAPLPQQDSDDDEVLKKQDVPSCPEDEGDGDDEDEESQLLGCKDEPCCPGCQEVVQPDTDTGDSTSLTIGPGDPLSPGYFSDCDGVFKNLTQLDVSENAIEVLDLSALSKLQTLQCSRNSLRELTVNGRHLTSLIAGNNQLRTLSASPTPLQLEHLDVSYNRLATLPSWVGGCSRLRALFASHNELTAVPQQLLSGQLPHLHTLQLSYNELQQLPGVSSRLPLALHHLFLQSNRLAALPCNLFTVATRLRVLNVSNNRLEELPAPAPAPMHDADGDRGSPLDKLYLTANCLGDAALRSLAAFRRLRTLHAAYNHLSVLPDSCVASWPDLEELVLSGNTLRHLPENIVQLRHLRVLRVHSNQLRNSPCFSRMTSLKVLDLSHNQLDRVSLATLAPPQLQFLDLSCNSRLHVDPRQFSVYRSQRQGGPGSISLVDVSGLNRSSLPTAPPARPPSTPWAVGFSETPGLRERLYISQLRLPSFCNSEGLFGLFDGGGEGSLPAALVRAVPRILVEERAVTETAADYLKYTLLSAHRELREHGQKQGACATLVHVCPRGSRYVLRVASVGEAKAILARTDGPLTLTREQPANSSRHPLESAVRSQLGCSALFPLVLPDPHVVELELRESDDFLVVANQRLWEVVSEKEAMQEVRAASSPLLAAKRLQDMAQSYGCEDNISVVVLRLGALALPSQTVAEMTPVDVDVLPPVSGSCSCCAPCCRCRHDRSSPSGQSDQASCESRPPTMALHTSLAPQPAPRRPMLNGALNGALNGVLNGGSGGTMYKATRCRVDNVYRGVGNGGSGGSGCSDSGGDTSCGSGSGTGSDRSHLSEEQFRCWEYMLEQNTQLLFDKELDTLSRAFTRRPVPRGQALGALGQAMGMGRALSSSSPHLAHSGAGPAPGTGVGSGPGAAGSLAPHPSAVPTPTPPFLSRHFGSARSLSCTPTSRRLGLGGGLGGLGGLHAGMGLVGLGSSRQLLHTGPNAAYFGSLQRLMPYNLEYDFDVIHERAENGQSMSGSLIDQRADTDSLEQDGRMRKYWDVATTEL